MIVANFEDRSCWLWGAVVTSLPCDSSCYPATECHDVAMLKLDALGASLLLGFGFDTSSILPVA
jgi:hypothetical protein